MNSFVITYLNKIYKKVYSNLMQCQVIWEKPQQLTFYVKSLLEENHKNYQITNDSAIMKIQTKMLSVIGPLTKLWSFIDGALNSNEDKVEFTM